MLSSGSYFFLFCHLDDNYYTIIYILFVRRKNLIIDILIAEQIQVPEADIDIIDKFYFLQTLNNVPNSYGKI